MFSLKLQKGGEEESNYEDEEYEDDEEDQYSEDEDADGVVDIDPPEGKLLVAPEEALLSANNGPRPRSTQSDPASTPTRQRSKQRSSVQSYSDNDSNSGKLQKANKKKAKSAKGKHARFAVTKPRRSITGDRDGGEWTDSEDEEDRRQQRMQDPRWSHVAPTILPSLGPKMSSQAPRVPAGSEREGTPLAMLSLAENARVLGLFQQRR